MMGIAATHVACNECGTLTEIDDGSTAADAVCPVCEDRGDDPTCVTAVAVVACPNGVTAAEWASGERRCEDANHSGRIGSHVIEVD